MAAVMSQPHISISSPHANTDRDRIMDTRTPSPSPSSPRKSHLSDRPTTASSTTSAHTAPDGDTYTPDLSAEVALLSTKLVNAINHQTNLDDSLQQTRHELDTAQRELARLRAQKKVLDDQVTSGALQRKAEVDRTMLLLRDELSAERFAREAADKSKKQTEGELETLTAALFEEANNMVAAARRETEAVERREKQVRGQLQDTELLLASQQEQLRDLKGVMGRMDEIRDSRDDGASVPGTPIQANTTVTWDALDAHSPSANGAPHSTAPQDITPSHPLHFSHLLHPVLRHDTAAYSDFLELLALSRHTRTPHSRNSSANHLPHPSSTASSSTSNLAATATLPGSFHSPQTSVPSTPLPPLKDSRFYKRSLSEDLEPTLRLDLAPGLSFLTRRTVLSSLLSGSLIVEPLPPSPKQYPNYGTFFACALCGETRPKEPRTHRFRTSESEDAQRYPLCGYCLHRVRAACDFVGFLRCVREGMWAGNGEGDGRERGAWEESVRLRERMFWARVGGGVVPRGSLPMTLEGSPKAAAARSNRASLESVPEVAAPSKHQRIISVAQVSGADPNHLDASTGDLSAHSHPLANSTEGSLSVHSSSNSHHPLANSTEGASSFAPSEHSSRSRQADSLASTKGLYAESEDEGATTPFEDASTERSGGASFWSAGEGKSVHSTSVVPVVKEPAAEVAAKEEKPERRPSAVQERIRAMEAKGVEQRVPGGF